MWSIGYVGIRLGQHTRRQDTTHMIASDDEGAMTTLARMSNEKLQGESERIQVVTVTTRTVQQRQKLSVDRPYYVTTTLTNSSDDEDATVRMGERCNDSMRPVHRTVCSAMSYAFQLKKKRKYRDP
jgi:hypothetical protein